MSFQCSRCPLSSQSHLIPRSPRSPRKNQLFVLSQQRYQLLYFLSREVLLLDEKVDEAGSRATEEVVLNASHVVAGVLAVLHQRIESVLLAYEQSSIF